MCRRVPGAYMCVYDASNPIGPTGSLMRVGRIALETVHHARLGGTERDPVLRGVLQRDEERFTSRQGSFVQLLSPFELDLKCELPDERAVIAAVAPQRHIGHGGHAITEVQHPDVLKHLLDNRPT